MPLIGCAAFNLILVCPMLQTMSAVVPAAHAKKPGNTMLGGPAYGSSGLPAHEQYVYSVGDFPRIAMLLRSLAFRKEATLSMNNPAVKVQLTVALSSKNVSPSFMGATFSANEGRDRKVVFSGTVAFKALPRGLSSSKPFEAARIPFSSSFLLVAKLAQSLVVDVRVAASTSKSSWFVDGVKGVHPPGSGFGWMTVNHTGFYCRDRNGAYVARVDQFPHQMVIGGAYEPILSPVPASVVGIASVGLVGVGGSWGGVKLPIGLPGAPGCSWAIAPLVTWAFLTDAKGVGRVPPLVIPHDQRFVGQSFYDQPAFLDAKANKLGLITSWSHKWLIGSAEHTAWLFRWNDTKPPSATAQRRYRGWAPIVQFTF